MATITTAYTATGNSAGLFVRDKQSYTYVVTGTFVATWIIESTYDQENYELVATGTGTQTSVTVIVNRNDSRNLFIRTRCSAFTSGTMTVVQADVADIVPEAAIIDADGATLFDAVDGSITPIIRTSQKYIIAAGAKVGGTSGGVVDAANDKGSLMTVAASQTAATMVIKIPYLKVGWTITGIGIVGQLESATNVVTVDCILRAQTAVASDNTDAAIGSGITQVSKTADYLIDDEETGLTEVVVDTKGYYILVTVTTGASTDVDILNVSYTVTEA